MFDIDTDAFDNAAAGKPLATLTKESCGDPADTEAESPLFPGPDDTPVIP